MKARRKVSKVYEKRGELPAKVLDYIRTNQIPTNPVWLSQAVIARELSTDDKKISDSQINNCLSVLKSKGLVTRIQMADGRKTWGLPGGETVMKDIPVPDLWLNYHNDDMRPDPWGSDLRYWTQKTETHTWQELLDQVRPQISQILRQPANPFHVVEDDIRLSAWVRWFLLVNRSSDSGGYMSASEADSYRYLLWAANQTATFKSVYNCSEATAQSHGKAVRDGIDNGSYYLLAVGQKVKLEPMTLDEDHETDTLDDLIEDILVPPDMAVGPVTAFEPNHESDQKWAQDIKAGTTAELERMKAQFASGRKAPESRKRMTRQDIDDTYSRYQERCRRMEDDEYEARQSLSYDERY